MVQMYLCCNDDTRIGSSFSRYFMIKSELQTGALFSLPLPFSTYPYCFTHFHVSRWPLQGIQCSYCRYRAPSYLMGSRPNVVRLHADETLRESHRLASGQLVLG